MVIKAKLMITNVTSGEKRDYAQVVDLETGGIASIAFEKGSLDNLEKLVPYEFAANASLGRYGLQVINFNYRKGGETQ